MPLDYAQVSTVVLTKATQAPAVEPADLKMLGRPQAEGGIRTPVLTVIPFEKYLLEMQPERLQLTTKAPQAEFLTAQAEALTVLVADYLGRKSVRAVGQNFAVRRRPVGAPPDVFMVGLLAEGVMSAVSVDSLNVVLELTYHMQRDGGYRIQVRVEPSQAEDLEAIFFGFNFHHDLTGGFGSYKDVERGMRIPDWMHQEVDRVSSSILERSRSVGGI